MNIEQREAQPRPNGQERGISFARERVSLPELNLAKELFGQEPVSIPTEWANEIKSTVGSLLETLTIRQKEVITNQLGIEGPPQSPSDIARELGISHERIRQLKNIAIQNLNKPPLRYHRILFDFLPPGENRLARIIFGDVTHREIREEVPNGPFPTLSLSESAVRELRNRSLLRAWDLSNWTIHEFLGFSLRPEFPSLPNQTLSEIFESLNNLKLQQTSSNS